MRAEECHHPVKLNIPTFKPPPGEFTVLASAIRDDWCYPPSSSRIVDANQSDPVLQFTLRALQYAAEPVLLCRLQGLPEPTLQMSKQRSIIRNRAL